MGGEGGCVFVWSGIPQDYLDTEQLLGPYSTEVARNLGRAPS